MATMTIDETQEVRRFVRETAAAERDWVQWMESIGQHTVRYGLVVVLLWIGGMKFTTYEAEAISGFVANSPLMSWAYSVFSVRGFSTFLGIVEIATGLLIAARPLYPGVAAAGGVLAVGTFATTLSFLLTTPGVWESSAGGFPAISAMPGQFLIKDIVLLGAAIWLFGEAWKAIRKP